MKKTLLSLGTLTAVVVPVASVVSCASPKDKIISQLKEQIHYSTRSMDDQNYFDLWMERSSESVLSTLLEKSKNGKDIMEGCPSDLSSAIDDVQSYLNQI